MSVHTAQCGDVYRDKAGKLWQVMWRCHEPTVGVVELVNEPVDEVRKQSGGVSGLMWDGFEKLEPASAMSASGQDREAGLEAKPASAAPNGGDAL